MKKEHVSIIKKVLEEAKHGSPEDRGRADAYYGRPHRPHKMVHTPGKPSKRVEHADLEKHEIKSYSKGYQDAIDDDFHKDWR